MKTTSILAALLGLFLMANSNVALAQDENTQQKDSIYGLEVSIVADCETNLSFYSTYNKNEVLGFAIDVYYEQQKIANASIDFGNFLGTDIITDIDEKIYIIDLQNFDICGMFYPLSEENREKIKKGSEIKIYLIMGYNSSNMWQSNVLTFFFSSLSTSVNEITSGDNYVYKYYLLSGIENKTKPKGIPFIQKTYRNDVLISTDKIMETK
jgi:hypothetical protein